MSRCEGERGLSRLDRINGVRRRGFGRLAHEARCWVSAPRCTLCRRSSLRSRLVHQSLVLGDVGQIAPETATPELRVVQVNPEPGSQVLCRAHA